MSLSKTFSLILFGAASMLNAQTPAETDAYERLLHLPDNQFLQGLSEENGKVTALVRGPRGDRVQILDAGPILTLEAGSPRGEGGPGTELHVVEESGVAEEGTVTPCEFDWQKVIKDPAAGLVHLCASLDGCTVLLLARDEDVHSRGTVFVFRNTGEHKMIQFEDLIQASLSPDGEMVLVQTGEEMKVYWTDGFLEGREPRSYAITGEEQWSVEHVHDDDPYSPGLFLLKKKLSVELYSTNPESSGEPPANAISLAEFFIETSDYAVKAEYDPKSRLMVVAERKRLRVARLNANDSATFLVDHKIDPRSDLEIRSCQLDQANARRSDGAQVRVALGLRRNVVKPSQEGSGSCEVQFLVLLASEDQTVSASRRWHADLKGGQAAPEAARLFESDWEAVERFRADSPAVLFSQDGARLFASTRDQVWRCEVAQ